MGIYKLALAVQPGHAKLLPSREGIVSGSERGPSDALRCSQVVTNGAHVDDPYSSGRTLLCSRRENGKEQLGKVKVTCESLVEDVV